ncbi:unnamed protein product [Phytomonas sp. Hart1]|nr:unnamed protein product [Phytomonas sp. Hart1]|eukprot:CCW71473.1 unnamed protein product [Phytomonas sp. isolate Hart1]
MSIEVHVRVRPEVGNSVWSSAETVLYSTNNPNTRYVYNKVHPNTSTNHTIFQSIEAIIHAAFNGKNVTVMAYGQTGSGKTHSMIGLDSDAGIVPRAAKLLIELKKSSPGTSLEAYYTEIYNESVKDLLEPQRGELVLHDAPDGGVTFDKRTVSIDTFEDFLRVQAVSEKNRKYGVTNLNSHSSRSHIILTFEIYRSNRTVKSLINLVDLAGSESASRANTGGMSLREGGFINRSLLTLGNVVDAIVEKRPYIPYRDAKLTRILRTCLGGFGITFILCCINPSRENFEQTLTTLRLTQRAMRIKNDPLVLLPLPPLFTHQYSKAAHGLVEGLTASSQAEYQRGLRDAFMYASPTLTTVVAHHRAQVADPLEVFVNLQRLLLAHDHALGIDQIGRRYNQLNDLRRGRLQNQELAESERKRQREVEMQLGTRQTKMRKLEEEKAEKASIADTELAGWEYLLHEAHQRQVSKWEVLRLTERVARDRLRYDWAVGAGRIAARYVSKLSGLTTTVVGTSAEGPVNGSRASFLRRMQERLQQAKAQLADLEVAHEMVREDVELARRGPALSSPPPLPTATRGSSPSPPPRPPLQEDEVDIEARIRALEAEERALKTRMRLAARQESLRQVRASLCGASAAATPVGKRTAAADVVQIDEAEESDTKSPICGTTRGVRRGRLASAGVGEGRSRDVYAHGVRNALTVLDSLKTRLVRDRAKPHVGKGGRRGGVSHTPNSSSSITPSSTLPLSHSENKGQRRKAGKGEEPELTLFELYQRKEREWGVHRSSVKGKSNKEDDGRGGSGQLLYHLPIHRHRNSAVELKGDGASRPDLAFNSVEEEGNRVVEGRSEPPVVGIAARRRSDHRAASSRVVVERALYTVCSNSTSPSMERRSRTRRGGK